MTDAEFLQHFETGSLPKEQWNHAAHLRVAGCYLLAHTPEEALNLMRSGVKRYNEATGGRNTEVSGYHETLTRFWLAVGQAFLTDQPVESPLTDKIQALVDQFGQRRDLFKEYYSFDVVKSRQARREWIAPDLKILP